MNDAIKQTRTGGFWFDLLFILLSFFVLPKIGRMLERLFEGSFRDDQMAFNLIAIAVILTFAGKWVALFLIGLGQKRDDDEEGSGSLWILQLPTTLLSTAFVVLGIVIPLRDAGIVDLTQGDWAIGLMALLFLAIDAILLIGFYSQKRDQKYPVPVLVFSMSALFAYVFLWQSFYNYFLAIISKHALDSVINLVGVAILSGFVFVMFYIGPRSLLQFSERDGVVGWLRMLLVFVVSFVVNLAWGYI